MRTYETTFIVNPQTDDATIDNQVGAISKLITDNGGKILHENRMGTRRLAYPIQKLTQGYYTTFVYEGTAKILPILDRHFNLGESYLRHMTILFEGNLERLNAPKDDSYDSYNDHDNRDNRDSRDHRDNRDSRDRRDSRPERYRPEPRLKAAAAPVEVEEEERVDEPVEEIEESTQETAEVEEPKIGRPSKAEDYDEDDEL